MLETHLIFRLDMRIRTDSAIVKVPEGECRPNDMERDIAEVSQKKMRPAQLSLLLLAPKIQSTVRVQVDHSRSRAPMVSNLETRKRVSVRSVPVLASSSGEAYENCIHFDRMGSVGALDADPLSHDNGFLAIHHSGSPDGPPIHRPLNSREEKNERVG